MFDMTNVDFPFDPRRVRRWDVSPQQLVQWLNQLCNPNGITCYEFLKCEALPDGFTVLSSFEHRDPYRLSFYIHHPSFEPVPFGQSVPPVERMVMVERVVYPPAAMTDEPHTTAATPR